ncbi:MAG: hypothetical protein ACK5M7_16275 [Draconibacterium sp.]
MLKALSTYITKFFALAFLIGNGVYAQEDTNQLKISRNTLQGSTWQIVGPENSTPFVVEFTGDKLIQYYDGMQVGIYDYYLSPNSEKGKKFDKRKTGKKRKVYISLVCSRMGRKGIQ